MQIKYKENTKKAVQPTSKQDGQFMAIHPAQAEQDMDQDNMFLPKLPLPASERKQKKADQTSTKTCMHYLCFDKTIPGHETLQTMEVNIMQKIQRKMQKGSSTYLKNKMDISWQFTWHRQNRAQTKRTCSCPNCHSARLKKAHETSTERACTICVFTRPYLGMRLCKQYIVKCNESHSADVVPTCKMCKSPQRETDFWRLARPPPPRQLEAVLV